MITFSINTGFIFSEELPVSNFFIKENPLLGFVQDFFQSGIYLTWEKK